jgi:hypothetical protein
MNEFSHLAIVTSQHGEKYLGYISASESNPSLYVEECVKNNQPIRLFEVRLFVTQVTPEVSKETGQLLGVKAFAALLPVDVFAGAMESLYVRPSSWYFANEVPSLKKKLDQLLGSALRNEEVNRAREAGILVPGRPA